MKPNQTIANKNSLCVSMDYSLKIEPKGTHKTPKGISNTTNISSNPKKHDIDHQENKKEEICLKTDVIKKMLSKFLLEKKMKEEELANALSITPKELGEFLLYEKIEEGLVNKINLPLIKLYCATRWLQK